MGMFLEVAAHCGNLLKAVPFQTLLGRHLPQTADHSAHLAPEYPQQAITGKRLPVLQCEWNTLAAFQT